MRKKLNFKVIDFIIVLFCLAGICASAVAFWRVYNTTLVKTNEDPVGTIIFKKRSAERKFIDRSMWDRLKMSSPVYDGDRIRTIEQSEAVVIFQDQVTYLSMDANTIVQIFYNDQGGAQIDFSGGNLEVTSTSKDILVSSGDSVIKLDGQSKLYKDEDGFYLSVLEGQANFDGKEIETGDILAVDSNGEIDTKPMIVMTSFSSAARVLGRPGEAVPVDFSWNEASFDIDTHVIVEIASDPQFNDITETREISGATSVSIPVRNGNYWWRAYPVNSTSRSPANRMYPSGTLEVEYTSSPNLLEPSPGAEFIFREISSVPLSWSAVENVSAYLLEFSANSDMSSPALSRHVMQNTITQSGLESGHWYWRVTPVFPSWVKAPVLLSEISEFTLIRGIPVLSEPVLTFPVNNGKTYTNSDTNWLLWRHDPNAVSWYVELADNPRMERPTVRKNVSSNYFSLSPSLLQVGKTWYWRVSALGGVAPAVSEIWNFEVVSDAPPSARPVLSGVPYIPGIVFDANTGFEGNPDIERLLMRIASTLNEFDEYKVRIIGHANPTVNPGDLAGRQREQIQELQPLSELRAKDIADQLIILGIDSSRLEYFGMGGERPLTTWDDVGNWWKNRRVEFVLFK